MLYVHGKAVCRVLCWADGPKNALLPLKPILLFIANLVPVIARKWSIVSLFFYFILFYFIVRARTQIVYPFDLALHSSLPGKGKSML